MLCPFLAIRIYMSVCYEPYRENYFHKLLRRVVMVIKGMHNIIWVGKMCCVVRMLINFCNGNKCVSTYYITRLYKFFFLTFTLTLHMYMCPS